MSPDFEQNHLSKTAEGIYKVRHDSIRIRKLMAYNNRFYEDSLRSMKLMAFLIDFIKI